MTNPQNDTYKMDVQDPSSGEWHTFTGNSMEEVDAAADEFFGVDIAEKLEKQ